MYETLTLLLPGDPFRGKALLRTIGESPEGLVSPPHVVMIRQGKGKGDVPDLRQIFEKRSPLVFHFESVGTVNHGHKSAITKWVRKLFFLNSDYINSPIRHLLPYVQLRGEKELVSKELETEIQKTFSAPFYSFGVIPLYEQKRGVLGRFLVSRLLNDLDDEFLNKLRDVPIEDLEDLCKRTTEVYSAFYSEDDLRDPDGEENDLYNWKSTAEDLKPFSPRERKAIARLLVVSEPFVMASR